jgi:CHAD domain-containing protein
VQDAGRAKKKADLWLKVMEQPLAVRVESDSANNGHGAAHRGDRFTSSDSISYAAGFILSHQLEKLRSHEEAVRANTDPEGVHDMRVACRRINSAIRIFKPYLSPKQLKRVRPLLEELRDTLGNARNLDVLCGDLQEYRSRTDGTDTVGLEPLEHAWSEERSAAQRDLVKLLDSPNYEEWIERMVSLVKPKETSKTPRVSAIVPGLVWDQYGTVRGYDRELDQASLEDLHALRIHIKRLRYLLEFFREPMESADEPGENLPDSSDLIKPLVALQDQLGSIQDAVVAGQMLTRFIAHQARAASRQSELAPDFQAVAAYHSHVQKRIGELKQGVPERWRVILSPDYRQTLGRAVAGL